MPWLVSSAAAHRVSTFSKTQSMNKPASVMDAKRNAGVAWFLHSARCRDPTRLTRRGGPSAVSRLAPGSYHW